MENGLLIRDPEALIAALALDASDTGRVRKALETLGTPLSELRPEHRGMIVIHGEWSEHDLATLRRQLFDSCGKLGIVISVSPGETVETRSAEEVARLGLAPLTQGG